jgi:DNA-binding NtrC family response regulator
VVSEAALLSTQLIEGENARLELDAADLRVIVGPDRGTAVSLGLDTVLIGSDPACDLVLHDPTVSRRHAAVTSGSRGYFLRDLASRNGVMIGAISIERARIHDGMRIRLGASELLVRAHDKRRSIPLSSPGRFGSLVASSVKMRVVVATLQKLAAQDMTVLFEGESGTGKEVAAEALHRASPRAAGPFVVLDCGAVAPSLLAGELFGHERGEFSEAAEARPGILEQAEGGTLFLDEVGEVPLDLQPALLRLLERKTYRRVGSMREEACNARIIAATNRNLAGEVRQRRFREDLYSRLAVARVRIPPLRERQEDVLVLLEAFALDLGVTLTPEARVLFTTHSWPGNVRELRNTLERFAVVRDAPAAIAQGIPPANEPFLYDDGGRLRPLPEARRLASDDLERRYIERALVLGGGRMSRAAEIAGLSRRFFASLATKHGLKAWSRSGSS